MMLAAMRPFVRVQLEQGPPTEKAGAALSPSAAVAIGPRDLDAGVPVFDLGPGDIIGRTWAAAMRLDDPQISEAHALVSLRGSALKLLALRGRFSLDAVQGVPLSELELAVGQRIRLAPDIALEVLELQVPREVLALEGDGLPRQVLGGVCSLKLAPRPTIVPGFANDADAVFWNDGIDWSVRIAHTGAPSTSLGEDRPLVPGDTLEIPRADGMSQRFDAVSVPLDGVAQTRAWEALEAPLVLIVRYDTVHIHRELASLALDGISARILSELATIALPVSWQAVAHEVWPDEDDLVALRRKWDTSLARLRKKLRDSRIRQDLVRADGNGNFEIFLRAGDRVEDQT